MRVVLFASNDFALPLLELLHRSYHEIVAIYTQPPSISGRGLLLKHGSIGKRALELSMNLRHPQVMNEPEQMEYFSGLAVDIAIVAAYGQILSPELLIIPRFGFLNLHPSLLPRWRGAAPIERAIMEGDELTGVCTIKMIRKLDAGPILAQANVPIGPEATAQSLSTLLGEIGAAQVLSTLDSLSEILEIPQSNSGICYAKKIMKKETRIDWHSSAEIIDRTIRGLSPSPGAWCMLKDSRVKILDSRVLQLRGNPGCRLESNEKGASLIVACGEGAILISRIQREGKKPISGEEFIRGYKGDFKLE